MVDAYYDAVSRFTRERSSIRFYFQALAHTHSHLTLRIVEAIGWNPVPVLPVSSQVKKQIFQNYYQSK
jgi:hypothetical protein